MRPERGTCCAVPTSGGVANRRIPLVARPHVSGTHAVSAGPLALRPCPYPQTVWQHSQKDSGISGTPALQRHRTCDPHQWHFQSALLPADLPTLANDMEERHAVARAFSKLFTHRMHDLCTHGPNACVNTTSITHLSLKHERHRCLPYPLFCGGTMSIVPAQRIAVLAGISGTTRTTGRSPPKSSSCRTTVG